MFDLLLRLAGEDRSIGFPSDERLPLGRLTASFAQSRTSLILRFGALAGSSSFPHSVARFLLLADVPPAFAQVLEHLLERFSLGIGLGKLAKDRLGIIELLLQLVE